MEFSAKIIERPPSVESILKQIRFGTAKGLTVTAQQGQKAVQTRLREKFIIRNQWPEKGPLSIKITPATPATQTAEIKTAARFLPLQESGGPKIPYKNFLAIPTKNARSTPTAKIPKAKLPKNLQNAFILTTKNGTKLLCIRKSRGKNKGVIPMYLLVPKAQIKSAHIFYDPIHKVVAQNLSKNISEGIDFALKTAK